MTKNEISAPVVIGIVVAVVLIAAFLLYRNFTSGGVQGDGRAGETQAFPGTPPPSSGSGQ